MNNYDNCIYKDKETSVAPQYFWCAALEKYIKKCKKNCEHYDFIGGEDEKRRN